MKKNIKIFNAILIGATIYLVVNITGISIQTGTLEITTPLKEMPWPGFLIAAVIMLFYIARRKGDEQNRN